MKAESNLGGLLGKSSRLLSNRLNTSLNSQNLTVEQWTLLAVLWSKDKQTQKALQLELLKDKATINSLVKYLLLNGFITKTQSIRDKRSFIIALSKKGKEAQNSTIPMAIEAITTATQDIDKTELETTLKVLNQIIINLTKENR